MSQAFRLESQYQPTGDQPKAIAQLTAGLESGEREQTLLGVTGSGKSVTGDTKVFIRRGESILCVDIQSVIDALFSDYPELVNMSGDSEFIDMSHVDKSDQFETVSFSPKTGTSSWSPVYQVSRHSTQKVMTLETMCGRSVTTTMDHNFYVVRDGALKLIEGKDVQMTDAVPVPRSLETMSGQGFEAVHLAHELSETTSNHSTGAFTPGSPRPHIV